MAGIARKDYEQRRARGPRHRESEGSWQVPETPIDKDLHKRVTELLGAGLEFAPQQGTPTAQC